MKNLLQLFHYLNTRFPSVRSAFFSPVVAETDETPPSSLVLWPLCFPCCTSALDDVPCAPDGCGEREWRGSDASAVSPPAWASRPTWASACMTPDRTRNGRRRCRRPRRFVCAYDPPWPDPEARASDPPGAAGAACRAAVAIRRPCCRFSSSDSAARCFYCQNRSCSTCSRARSPGRAKPRAPAPIGRAWHASAAASLLVVRPVAAATTSPTAGRARTAWTRRGSPWAMVTPGCIAGARYEAVGNRAASGRNVRRRMVAWRSWDRWNTAGSRAPGLRSVNWPETWATRSRRRSQVVSSPGSWSRRDGKLTAKDLSTRRCHRTSGWAGWCRPAGVATRTWAAASVGNRHRRCWRHPGCCCWPSWEPSPQRRSGRQPPARSCPTDDSGTSPGYPDSGSPSGGLNLVLGFF